MRGGGAKHGATSAPAAVAAQSTIHRVRFLERGAGWMEGGVMKRVEVQHADPCSASRIPLTGGNPAKHFCRIVGAPAHSDLAQYRLSLASFSSWLY